MKPIHISIIAKKEGTNTSFYFKGATIAQLSMINHELDILKREIIDRIDSVPKEYEVTEEDD